MRARDVGEKRPLKAADKDEPRPDRSTQNADLLSTAHDVLSLQRTIGNHAAARLLQARLNRTGLPDPLKRGVEHLSGMALDDVTVHYNSEKPAQLQALAYTEGTHIHVAPGQERHLPHEAWHVVQQAQGRVRPTLRTNGAVPVNDDAALEHEADVMGARAVQTTIAALRAPLRSVIAAAAVVQRRPAELIDGFSFLGNTVEGGLNATLRDRLVAVEAHLKGIYDALGPDHADRVHYGGGAKSLRDWSGITSVRSWRPDSKGLNATSKHASGSAVDVNYGLQPYIATRSTVDGKTVYGGEAAGAALQTQRKAATDVYDRAMAFVYGTGRTADVSSRKKGESTGAAYDRFRSVDQALSIYLRHAFLEEPTSVKRPPIADPDAATEDELLKAIPTTERRAETAAIGDLEALMGNTFSAGQQFQKSHPGWPYSPREQYFRMLRDYELVRVPMQRGDPSAAPKDTRNPTRGFLHMRREFVEAMVDVGKLRWGAVDLGEHTSGDVHHFDLGNHGGVTPDGTP
jgi:hypothetical protein